MSSEKQIVEVAGSLKVNCSTSCENPQVGGLETTLSKKVLEEHPQGKWKQFLVSNISQDTRLLCHFTCAEKQHSEHLNVRVYSECPCLGLHSSGRAHVHSTLPHLLSGCSWASHHGPHLHWALEPQAGQVYGLRICLHPWLGSINPPIPQKQTAQVLNLSPRMPVF